MGPKSTLLQVSIFRMCIYNYIVHLCMPTYIYLNV